MRGSSVKNKNIRTKLFHTGILVLIILSTAGWPDLGDLTSAKNIKKGLIDSTGIVTSDQVDSVVKAAEKIQDASRGLGVQQEYFLGRGVSALILKKYPLYTGNQALTHYINFVGSALAAHSSRPEIFGGYHFALLDTEEINALSAPGGFIFLSKGFLKIIPNEDALAAVLAHEIGHVILGHGVAAISNAKITEATTLLGKEALDAFGPAELSAVTNTFGDSVNQVFDTLITSGYSRSQEYEADAFAVALLTKSGYSARGLNVMLDQLGKVRGQSKGGWQDTHPAPGERKGSLKSPKQQVDPDGEAVRTARYLKISSGS